MRLTATLDTAATTLSAACIAHCLALPLVAFVLPAVAAFGQAEWVHWLFGILALAVSGSVPLLSPGARKMRFLLPAGLGMVFIALGLFAEHVQLDETLLTVAGGVLIAAAHLRRLF
jgi:hypothetical protein